MFKVILVERDANSFSTWKNLDSNKMMPNLSVVEIMKKYQGFTGEIVDYIEINEKQIDFERRLKELLQLKKLGSCFLLFVISQPDLMPKHLEDYAVKLGYEVGDCMERVSEIYCSIFHEILFGTVAELIEFRSVLNEGFLFPDRSTAEKYVTIHNEMSAQGRPVEDFMPMIIYEIWEYNEK